jgi:hypothetical protein
MKEIKNVNYDKVLSIKETSDYISNLISRDPTGYDMKNVILLLDDLKTCDKITFGFLNDKLSEIKIR